MADGNFRKFVFEQKVTKRTKVNAWKTLHKELFVLRELGRG
jgi:hypothetical protein